MEDKYNLRFVDLGFTIYFITFTIFFMTKEELKNRTKQYALPVARLVLKLSYNTL
jgi:hypothetical protein